MFCARCGQQIPDASEVCPMCGREASVQLQPRSTVDFPPLVAPAAPSFSLSRPDLQGIGGWLLVFCILTAVVTPLGNIASLSRLASIHSPWAFYYLAIVAFSIIVGASVWLASSSAIPLVRAYFISFVVWELARIGYLLVFTDGVSMDFPMMFRIRTLIWVAIWASYFHTSKRVLATFGRNL